MKTELLMETAKYQYLSTDLTWKDIKPKWINWKLLHSRPEYYIFMTTMMGTGKTFGCTDYYLRQRESTCAMLVNTAGVIPEQSSKLLDDLKQNEETNGYYENWIIKDAFWIDDEGNKRMYWAAISTSSRAKGARGFYPEAVIYDEINQNVEYAEQTGTTVKPKLERIVSRFVNDTFEPKHIYCFANKDVAAPIQGLTILNDLGIYTLKGLGEVFKVNNKFVVQDDLYIVESVLVINPVLSTEDIRTIAREILSSKNNQYKKSLIVGGGARQSMFNEDNWDFEHYISPTTELDGLFIMYTNNRYISISRRKDNQLIHIKLLDEIPEDYDNKILTWRKVENEKMFELSDKWKLQLQRIYYRGNLSYEDTISRVYFSWMVGKR